MNEYIFGANILENLTTGMYKDSKIIYREYIQNSCDQIDEALKTGLLHENEGEININLDETERTITIEDNATGIQSEKFRAVMSDIANSDKHSGETKGFRGIGRLCGLAYCEELVFRSKFYDENIISVLKCNAAKMRMLITQHNSGIKYTASEVLNQIYEFSTEITDDIDSHWFKVVSLVQSRVSEYN